MRNQLRSKVLLALFIFLAFVPAATFPEQGLPETGQATASPPRTVVTGSLAFDAPHRVSGTVAGQVFRFTFSGTAGEAVSLAEVNNARPCAVITFGIVKPDASALDSKGGCGSGSMNNVTLPATGTYTVSVNPGTAVGGITLTLTHTKTEPIGLGGPETVSSTLPGQAFNLTFDGTAGQRIAIAETKNTYPCGAMSFTLLKPNGVPLAIARHTCRNTSLDKELLPATGRYTVSVNPGWASGGAAFTVTAEAR